jgi:hypothetical protein
MKEGSLVKNMLISNLMRWPPRKRSHMEIEGAEMGGSDHDYRRCATPAGTSTAIVKSIYMGGWHCGN